MAKAPSGSAKKVPGRRSGAFRVHPNGKTGAVTHRSVGRDTIGHVTERYSLTNVQIAETAGLKASTLTRKDRRGSAKAQNRIREMTEILARVEEWAGSPFNAMAWYRSEPIPALDGRTAEALVKSGEANAVREYLDHIALGGFA